MKKSTSRKRSNIPASISEHRKSILDKLTQLTDDELKGLDLLLPGQISYDVASSLLGMFSDKTCFISVWYDIDQPIIGDPPGRLYGTFIWDKDNSTASLRHNISVRDNEIPKGMKAELSFNFDQNLQYRICKNPDGSACLCISEVGESGAVGAVTVELISS